jgi:hypothetical protein
MDVGLFVFFFPSIDECFLPHLYPLSLINADYLSAFTLYSISIMYCEIVLYPLFPTME